MVWDILKKEKEYLEENELLESKTKELLKKVEDVMQSRDILLQDPKENEKESTINKQKSTRSLASSVLSKASFDSEISLDDPFLPGQSCLNDMGQKAVHHFYKAKIKALKVEYEKLKVNAKTKDVEIKQLAKDAGHNAEEKDKWFAQFNVAKQNIIKLENQVTNLSSKLQAKENENVNLKKEIDSLKKEIKVITKNLNGNESKINRIHEENEKNKSFIKMLQREDKDLKDNHKKQIQEYSATIQHMEKQKHELVNGFKKQLQLIENLKQQKAHLQTFNINQIAEVEYVKLLEWKE